MDDNEHFMRDPNQKVSDYRLPSNGNAKIVVKILCVYSVCVCVSLYIVRFFLSKNRPRKPSIMYISVKQYYDHRALQIIIFYHHGPAIQLEILHFFFFLLFFTSKCSVHFKICGISARWYLYVNLHFQL